MSFNSYIPDDLPRVHSWIYIHSSWHSMGFEFHISLHVVTWQFPQPHLYMFTEWCLPCTYM